MYVFVFRSAGAVDDHMEDALHNAMGQWHKFTANVSLVLFGFVKMGCLHDDSGYHMLL